MRLPCDSSRRKALCGEPVFLRGRTWRVWLRHFDETNPQCRRKVLVGVHVGVATLLVGVHVSPSSRNFSTLYHHQCGRAIEAFGELAPHLNHPRGQTTWQPHNNFTVQICSTANVDSNLYTTLYSTNGARPQQNSIHGCNYSITAECKPALSFTKALWYNSSCPLVQSVLRPSRDYGCIPRRCSQRSFHHFENKIACSPLHGSRQSA